VSWEYLWSTIDPAKVISRVERYHVPNYLRARCIFFKKFLEDKKNDGKDLNYESFYMGLMLDDFIAWKAEEMTMNTSSPRVAKSRDLSRKALSETHPCSLLSNM
jgi:hypothetical protein